MRPRVPRWFFGLTCLLLIALLATATVQASPPPQQLQGERWLPFDGLAAVAQPELTLLSSDAEKIELQAVLPGCMAADVEVSGQRYTRLYGDGYGFPTEVGKPSVPVLRRNVEIPFDAEVTVEVVRADYVDYSLAALGLNPIFPFQPPLVKLPSAEDRPLSVDQEFYAHGSRYPSQPVALGEDYAIRGHRILPVEVHPVAYDPSAGTVRLYHNVVLRLHLSGSDMTRTAALAERYASPEFEGWLSSDVLNYNQGRPSSLGPDASVGYIVVVADAYYDAIQPFIALKEGRGFDVTTVTCTDLGGCTTANIKDYIQNAYDTWPVPPSYVLLVGDTNTVPTYTGPEIGTSTDLYYATMDGDTDWHPDIGRGRFPVRSSAQTTIMVDKYLAYATLTGSEPWLSKIAFPATCDNAPVAEGTHNYVINNYTLPGGYTGIFPNNPEPGGDKLYCISYSATESDVIASASEGRWMVIYSGHGSYEGWELLSQSNVPSIGNTGMFPFVASHACLSGDYGQTEVFGETWVLQPNKGALVYWGSSTLSYWDEDDSLEKGMFDDLFLPGTPKADVTRMTYGGHAKVETDYPGSARYYWETYNVLGDPAVKIFLEPDLPTFNLNVDPQEHELCADGTVTSTVVIGSLQNYSETVYLSTGPLPAGVTASFAPASAQAPYTSTLTVAVAPGTAADDYAIDITATDTISWTYNAVVQLYVRPGEPAAPALVAPADGATDQPLQPTVEWADTPFATTYHLQLGYTPAFDDPLIDLPGLPGTAYTTLTPLEGGRCYWWRTQADNACGAGPYAEPYHFSTVALGAAFYDDVENGQNGWTTGGTPDTWAITTGDSHSPTHSWTDSPTGQYGNYTDNWVQSPILDLSGASQVALNFWHKYDTEATYDFCHVEYSINGGLSWTELTSYDGSSSGWVQEEVDVPQLAHQANARLRFRLTSDVSLTYDGWYIDDVQVIVPLPPTPAPGLLDIVPDSGSAYVETPVQLHGAGFVDVPSLKLGETWLLSVTLVNSTTIDAVVPAGMPGGVYDLTLYNGDCQEALLADAYTVIVECVSPTLSVEAESPVELGQPAYLTATLLTGTPPLTWTWDMGGPGAGSGLDTPTPVFTYTAAGAFTATVNVANGCGQDSEQAAVTVVCTPPTATVSSDSPALLGEAIHFTSTVTGTGPFAYSWDFGDGGTSTEVNPVYTYTMAGDYTVTLTVEGACGTVVLESLVTVCEPPAAGFASDSPVGLGTAMHFTSTVTGSGPFTYAWTFGDGAGTSMDPNPAYTYGAAGDYTVTLTVEGACGTAVITGTVTMTNECFSPTVGFVSDSPVLLGEPMAFTSTVTGSGPFTYTWDFGDNGTSADANPVYTYTAAGSYTVTLTVTGLCGDATATAVVTVAPVQETFSVYLPLVLKNTQ